MKLASMELQQYGMNMKVPVAVIDVSKLDFLHASSGNCLIHLSRTTE